MRKVLVSDSLAPQGIEILRQAGGIEVVESPGLSPGDLLAAIGDIDALVIRSGTKVTADVIEAAPKLSAVGRAGIGVDNVDVAAWARFNATHVDDIGALTDHPVRRLLGRLVGERGAVVVEGVWRTVHDRHDQGPIAAHRAP